MSNAAVQTQNKDHLWKPGTSGNPGGRPKGLRALQSALTLAHGGKVLTALQMLFEMGSDDTTVTQVDRRGEAHDVPAVDAKTKVAALTAFVNGVGSLSGWASVARAPEVETPADEEALFERVVESVVSRRPELVAAKLIALKGGKAE